MKCPKCNGKGEFFNEVYNDGKRRREILIKCNKCNGTGYVDMTNEEWLHTLNTEEKAFALETIIRSVLVLRSPMCHDVCNREFWERWLKEKHNDGNA